MRSLRLLLNLVHDLERLSMTAVTPLSARSSMFFDQWPAWNRLNRFQRYAIETPLGKNDFQLKINVQDFKPNELRVKVVDDTIVVEGNQETSPDDNSYFSHHFVRRYALPVDFDVEKVKSTLSPDGMLTITIPKPLAVEDKVAFERPIEIQQTGVGKEEVAGDKQEIKQETSAEASLKQ